MVFYHVQNCPEEETTILVRRFMMRIAEKIAEKGTMRPEWQMQKVSSDFSQKVREDRCLSMSSKTRAGFR